MQTAKTDQTGWMPRLIRVYARRTGHSLSFVIRWLILPSCVVDGAGTVQSGCQLRITAFDQGIMVNGFVMRWHISPTCAIVIACRPN